MKKNLNFLKQSTQDFRLKTSDLTLITRLIHPYIIYLQARRQFAGINGGVREVAADCQVQYDKKWLMEGARAVNIIGDIAGYI